MKIFLVGYMASGKTTCGKQLATKIDFKFIDL
ncbi:shikimate kinase, partial [Flavobacteriaceae bacterium]|nr:shikimate kinase [Flavobacteriaceae bacterium]